MQTNNRLIVKMEQLDIVDALWWFIHQRNGFEKGNTMEAVLYLKKRVSKYRRDRNEVLGQ